MEEVEFLWMNEDSADFVFEEEIIRLNNSFRDKLYLNKFCDPNLYSLDFTQSDEILQSLSGYESGRLAILCCPEHLNAKVKSLFVDIGYPSDNILCIESP